MPARDHLIVALDFPTAVDALVLVDRLEDQILWYKVGLELYLAAGPSIVESLRSRGFNVFVDLKLHDIPNTVAGAVRSLSTLGASFVTVHAAGGRPMLLAAAEAAAQSTHPPQLLAVTVLTSIDPQTLAETGVLDSPAGQVLRLGALAHAAGINGLVCSPQEVAQVRKTFGPESTLVVPGIRLATSAPDDQSRTATPSAALADGASYIVVGRPISQSANPAQAAANILDQIASADEQ